MRKLLPVVTALAVAATVACASHTNGPPPPPFYRPGISFGDARLAGVGLTGGALDIALTIYNPNDYEIAQPRVAYRLLFDRTQVAHGTYDANVVVNSRDSATIRVPVPFSYGSAARAGQLFVNTGAMTYRVIGELLVETPYGRYRVPYDRGGWVHTLSAQLPR